MKSLIVFLLLALTVQLMRGRDAQDSLETGPAMCLDSLLAEALTKNPEIRAARSQAASLVARVRMAGVLDDPQFTYMREQMPGFQWSQAMMQKFELMQMIRFPTKLSGESELAQIQAGKEQYAVEEKVNDVLAKVTLGFTELWVIQESLVLNAENLQLVGQFISLATAKYSAGGSSLQEVLKASVERTKLENERISLRQQELSARAMLVALLGRAPDDTLGAARLPDLPEVLVPLDTLQQWASRARPAIRRDSLAVDEGRTMLTLARREYLPDLRFGIQYVTEPAGEFRGWSVAAGISLPFAPWTLGKAAGRAEEAEAAWMKSVEEYKASQLMVAAEIKDLYYKLDAARRRLTSYRENILPQAERALQAGISAYQTGKSDILMLLDSFRTFVELRGESLMSRMQFERALVNLERAVGYGAIGTVRVERITR